MDKFNKIKYNNEFKKSAYDRIEIFVEKGKKQDLKEHAALMKESMNQFINRAIDRQIEEDEKRKRGE